MDNIMFLAIGLAAGVLAGMFGIGGGIVIVPALMLLAKFPPQVATGTSLGALLLPIGLLGAYAYHREGNVRVAPALLIALGIFVGAYFGARVSLSLPPQTLKRAFAVFLVAVAGQMWFGR